MKIATYRILTIVSYLPVEGFVKEGLVNKNKINVTI
jgi:hypothetical protein